ncbi:MAG: hypothetical protein SOW84_02125 [Candidatus Faecousia sp.]|nr:hypothetical protein [Candidatus Faecousia sp.]
MVLLGIFAIQDSFGTACNVTADSALTLILTGYCECSAFTVIFQTNAGTSPLAGQPVLMHINTHAPWPFLCRAAPPKRMGIQDKMPGLRPGILCS